MAAAAAAGRTYVDFVPPHSLMEEPDNVVLRVDLAAEGFKKEQLRVQIDNFGRLRVSGERPFRADSNHWRRFSRDFQVPEGCDAGAIRARLDKGGVLLITMPRLSPAAGANAGGVDDAQDQQKDHTSSAQQEAAAAAEAEEENKQDHKEEAGGASTEHRDQDEQHDTSNSAGGAALSGQKTMYGSAKSRRGMIWAIVAVMLALVGAGLYARYRMTDPSAETASAGTQIVALCDN
ncbi:hypothetical protein QOZ80_3AG0234260 [Eleusine coracana subsp. coracana]|nr:hypothetical protein QOZ80_3AG0234260 [Eleusine coracana subsp. coracana]